MTIQLTAENIVTYSGFFIAGLGAIVLGIKKYLEPSSRRPEYDGEDRRKNNTLIIDDAMVFRIVKAFEDYTKTMQVLTSELQAHGKIEEDTNSAMKRVLEMISTHLDDFMEKMGVLRRVEKRLNATAGQDA